MKVDLEGFANVSWILKSGVYALLKNGVVIYIGQSKGMISRIATHRSQWGAKSRGKPSPDWMPTKGILFDEVWVRPCSLDVLDELEREMIDLYKPKFNTRLKPPGPIKALTTLQIGGFAVALNRKPELFERRI